MTRILRFMFSAGLLLTGCLLKARSVSPEEAQMAAGHWVRNHAGLFCSSSTAETAEPMNDTRGNLLGYCVPLTGGGAIILSGDTEVEPVIAVLPEGCYRALPADHPLPALAKTALYFLCAERGLNTQAARRWEALLGADMGSASAAKLIAVLPGWDDGTYNHWNQAGGNRYLSSVDADIYNRYIPYSYRAGPIAVAGASVLQYAAVSGGPEKERRACKVDCYLMNLDTVGGTYDWSLLPSRGWIPEPQLSEEAKKLLGVVLYDVGVCINTNFRSDGAYAKLDNLMIALRFDFGLRGATYHQGKDAETFRTIIESDVRSGRPLPIIVVTADGGKHTVVATGFGVDAGGAPLTRLFMGRGGEGDAWLLVSELARLSAAGSAGVISGIDALPGRYPVVGALTDAAGRPRAGVSVAYRTSTGARGSVMSDRYGNYVLMIKGNHVLREPDESFDTWVELTVGDDIQRLEIPESLRHGLRGPDFRNVAPAPEDAGLVLDDAFGGVTQAWLKRWFPEASLATIEAMQAVAAADQDGDGWLTWQEFVLGTDPTDARDTFAVTGVRVRPGELPELSFERKAGRMYTLQGASSPSGPWSDALPKHRYFRVHIERR